MYTQNVTINNEVGLHARPATFFIQKANEFKSGIWLEKDERRVNAKSLLGVLSLGIVKGTTITLLADGADEKEIENKIKNTAYYFKGYETSVRFIDENEFEKNHKSLAHGGRVAATSSGAKLDFSIALQSNPDFTAKILLTYARAAVKMNEDGVIGGLSVLDVPPKYLCHDDDFLRFL